MDIDTFTGVVRTYHDQEQTILKEEYFQLNGKRNGIYREYHNNNNRQLTESEWMTDSEIKLI